MDPLSLVCLLIDAHSILKVGFAQVAEEVFKKDLFMFRERGREEESEGEKHRKISLSRPPPFLPPSL